MRHGPPFLTLGLIALGAVVLTGLATWAAQRGRPALSPAARPLVFRYNLVLRWFAVFAAFGVPAVITMLVVTFPPRNGAAWYVFGAYGLIAGLGLPLFWETSRYYVYVSPVGLERRSAWAGVRVIPWDEICEVNYNSFNAWFVFVAENGQRIRVHALTGRLDSFLRQVELRLPPATLTKARPGYARFGRPMPRLGNEPVLEALPPRR